MAAYVAADAASNLAGQIEELGRLNQLATIEPFLAKLRERRSKGRSNGSLRTSQTSQRNPHLTIVLGGLD